VRINCSLCGVKMLDLDLCLSGSVNVMYILHTQPLRFIHNKILVWVSLYPSLSLSILVGLPFSPPTPFATIACYPSTSPSFSLSHQPLLFRRQKMLSSMPMTMVTTMLGTHHLLCSCWTFGPSFWRPWCNGNMSIERCLLQKEDPYQERQRMLLPRP
jgi:hypothetical protein